MDIERLKRLPETLLGAAVQSCNGEPITVGSLLSGQPTLLLFVRHFGCIGCSENIAGIAPRFSELHQLGVRIAIIGCGAPMFIEGFIERHRLIGEPIEVYTDESLEVHKAAKLHYGSWGGFGPRGLLEMTRAFIGGHTAGPVEGDTKQQAGAIFVDSNGIVQLYHRAQSLGDHVDSVHLVDTAITSCLAANPELV